MCAARVLVVAAALVLAATDTKAWVLQDDLLNSKTLVGDPKDSEIRAMWAGAPTRFCLDVHFDSPRLGPCGTDYATQFVTRNFSSGHIVHEPTGQCLVEVANEQGYLQDVQASKCLSWVATGDYYGPHFAEVDCAFETTSKFASDHTSTTADAREAQQWIIMPDGKVKSVSTGKCLDAGADLSELPEVRSFSTISEPTSGTSATTSLRLWDCQEEAYGQINQAFNLTGDGYLKQDSSGRCVNGAESSLALTSCAFAQRRFWKFVHHGDNDVRLGDCHSPAAKWEFFRNNDMGTLVMSSTGKFLWRRNAGMSQETYVLTHDGAMHYWSVPMPKKSWSEQDQANASKDRPPLNV